MFKPTHPGIGLREDFEALGLSIAQAAKALGVTRQQLYRLVNAKSAVSPEMALRLETVIGSTAEAWLMHQAAYDAGEVKGRRAEITQGLKRIHQPVHDAA